MNAALRIAMALSLLLPAVARAQAVDDDSWLARVRPGANSHFYNERTGCPALAAKCRRTAYLVPGDFVVALEERDGFSFVEFVNPGGRTSWGWIENATLQPAIPVPAAPEAWLGDWTRTEADLRITRSPEPDRFVVNGSASWGGSDPDRVARGGIHVGIIVGDGVVQDGRLAFSIGDPDEPGGTLLTSEEGTFQVKSLPYDAPRKPDGVHDDRCRVRMRLLGPYLIVVDNDQCGAANVTFTGVYRRAP